MSESHDPEELPQVLHGFGRTLRIRSRQDSNVVQACTEERKPVDEIQAGSRDEVEVECMDQNACHPQSCENCDICRVKGLICRRHRKSPSDDMWFLT